MKILDHIVMNNLKTYLFFAVRIIILLGFIFMHYHEVIYFRAFPKCSQYYKLDVILLLFIYQLPMTSMSLELWSVCRYTGTHI